MNHSTRIPNQNNEVIVTFLKLLLADEYVLYIKTRTAHWNIVGANYFEMHVFLGNQYNELDVMIDKVAEQIRALGHFALGSLKCFRKIANIYYDNNNLGCSVQIFETLKNDHESLALKIQHEINPVSDKFKDRTTADFLSEILEQHKKMARMLRMFISDRENKVKKRIRIINNQSVIYGAATP